MAFLPKGWGQQVADAQETVSRQRLKDGEYLFLHKTFAKEKTRKGEALIITHKIVDAKKIVANADPSPVGTDWGYFLPDYGDAAVMLMPNVKAYILGLLGMDPNDLKTGKITKEQFAGAVDAISDERQLARGMLIKGVTFHVPKEDGEDFMGVNWYPVPGENDFRAPSVLKRRQDLDAEKAGMPAAPPAQQQAAPPMPPTPGASAPPPPPAADPIAAHLAMGWKQHPSAPDFFYIGGTHGIEYKTKSKLDIMAGR